MEEERESEGKSNREIRPFDEYSNSLYASHGAELSSIPLWTGPAMDNGRKSHLNVADDEFTAIDQEHLAPDGFSSSKPDESSRHNSGFDESEEGNRLLYASVDYQQQTALRVFSCADCGTPFNTKSDLRHHKRYLHYESRTQRHKCLVCGRGFRYPKDVRRHMKSHPEADEGGGAELSIPLWTGPAMDNGHKSHLNVANDEFTAINQEYMAPDGFSSSKPDELLLHNSGLHDESQTQRHKCLVCGRGFRYPKDVRRHMKSHPEADEGGNHFPFCQNVYQRPEGLRRHLRSPHTDDNGPSALLSGTTPSPTAVVPMSTGSPKAQYNKIGFAKGRPTNAGLRAEAAVTISAGKYVNVGTKIMRGIKDTPEYLKTEDYVRNMDAATQWKVVLSDIASQQHWLADGASVILHMCRAWLSGAHTRLAPKGVAEKLWSPLTAAGPAASFETLVHDPNRALQLYTADIKSESKASIPGQNLGTLPDEGTVTKEWFLLQHQAQFFYHWLEQIHDRKMQARHSSDIDLIGFLGRRTQSVGFEFKDLLSGKTHLEPCTLELEAGARAWLPYIRSVDAIQIHCSRLGALIRPTNRQTQQPDQCNREMPAPQGNDYLMAPLSVIREGIERFEHTDVCVQLADNLYWNQVDDSFSACRCQHPKSDGQCKAIIRKFRTSGLSRSRSCLIPDDLPKIFENNPSAAVIIGSEPETSLTERLKPHLPGRGTAMKKRKGDKDRDAEPQRQVRSASDSGYGTNYGTGSSSSGVGSSGSPSHGSATEDGADSESPTQESTKRRKVGNGLAQD